MAINNPSKGKNTKSKDSAKGTHSNGQSHTNSKKLSTAYQDKELEVIDRVLHDHHKLTIGQHAADNLTYWAGSWTFILSLILILIVWIALNVYALTILHWDPYPFILLNLVLSCLAAFQAPVILMSQNRAAERDRLKAQRDYDVNRKAEKEIANVQTDLDEIKRMIKKIYDARPDT